MGKEKNKLIIPTTLNDIIYYCTKGKRNFIELDSFQKREVLRMIQENSIDCKVFEYKGYDILKQCFFTQEWQYDESLCKYNCNRIEFNTFNEYYEYVQGDVFDNACYFGYNFSNDILLKLGKNVNITAYSKDTIDNYSFEQLKLLSQKEHEKAFIHCQKMKEWFDLCPIITTYDELKKQLSIFKKKFHDFYDLKIFFQYIINKSGSNIKDAVVKYARLSNYDIPFEHILLTFGIETAQSLITNDNSIFIRPTNAKRKSKFRKMITSMSKTLEIVTKTFGEFNQEYQIFAVKKNFFNNDKLILSNKWYFLSFEEFALFLDNDLSDCDLSEAYLLNIDFSKYKINNNTKLPKPNSYSSYKVLKGFDKNKFYVRQCWFDNNGNEIQNKMHNFDFFCDFFYFVHGDLSESDMIMCDGIENIKTIPNINIQGIKVRSNVAHKLGLIVGENVFKKNYQKTLFPIIEKNEIESVNTYLENHQFDLIDSEYDIEISYITDIHLTHRFIANKCETKEDCMFVMKEIIDKFQEQTSCINLIGGDISSNVEYFKDFFDNLSKSTKVSNFVTLGNHELWNFGGVEFNDIVSYYKNVLSQKNLYLVQNNLFLISYYGIKEISEERLTEMSAQELREETRDTKLIIFGGIGFSGKNNEFNANNGIYRQTINRQREIELSNKFDMLYQKVANVLFDKNVIVFTHMPMEDWSGLDCRVNSFVYVSGHNHRNYFLDNGEQRIYSDNQVGYNGKSISLKHLSMNYNYDWFSDYKDGIYEISRKDYEWFYRGISETLTFDREFENLYMLKKDNTYMFLMTSKKGSLLLLNGGQVKKLVGHTIEYYYNNLGNYSNSIKMYLSKYGSFQKSISKEIKQIGGEGKIHGCIIDIDFYNHLYINPLDGKIVPYFANFMTEKYVYRNIPSLLMNECPRLCKNYLKEIENISSGSLVIAGNTTLISSKTTLVSSTEMYRISRIIKSLQFTTKYNLVRLWNDAINTNCSADNGRLLVSGIIYPEIIESN